MPDSDFDIATALAERRQAGDVTPMTCREAQALRAVRDRGLEAEGCFGGEAYRRMGFEVGLSAYMVSLMRLRA